MRIIFLLFVLLTSLASQESPVQQVLEEQQAAWNRHDLEAFMAGYWNSPELTFFGAKRTSGWQATLDRYRMTYQGAGREMGNLEFSDLKVEQLAPTRRLFEAVGNSRCQTAKLRTDSSRWCLESFLKAGRSCTITVRWKSNSSLLNSHLHPGAIRQLAVGEFDYTISYHSFEFLRRDGKGGRRRRPWRAACAFVHSLIGQIVGFAITFAKRVIDGKPLQLRNQLFGAGMKLLQGCILHLIDAFDLAHKQLRVAYCLERFIAVFDTVLERHDQPLVLREIVGLVAQVLAECGNFAAAFILN